MGPNPWSAWWGHQAVPRARLSENLEGMDRAACNKQAPQVGQSKAGNVEGLAQTTGQMIVGLSAQSPLGPPMGQNPPGPLRRAPRPPGHRAAALPSAPLQHICVVNPGPRKPARLPRFESSGVGVGGVGGGRGSGRGFAQCSPGRNVLRKELLTVGLSCPRLVLAR